MLLKIYKIKFISNFTTDKLKKMFNPKYIYYVDNFTILEYIMFYSKDNITDLKNMFSKYIKDFIIFEADFEPLF